MSNAPSKMFSKPKLVVTGCLISTAWDVTKNRLNQENTGSLESKWNQYYCKNNHSSSELIFQSFSKQNDLRKKKKISKYFLGICQEHKILKMLQKYNYTISFILNKCRYITDASWYIWEILVVELDYVQNKTCVFPTVWKMLIIFKVTALA